MNMSTFPTTVIILTNNSVFNYRLLVPFFNFTYKVIFVGGRNQYSVNIPYNPNGSINCLLQSTNGGPALTFLMDDSGFVASGGPGLSIFTVAADLYLSTDGSLLPGVDTRSNNGMIIQ